MDDALVRRAEKAGVERVLGLLLQETRAATMQLDVVLSLIGIATC